MLDPAQLMPRPVDRSLTQAVRASALRGRDRFLDRGSQAMPAPVDFVIGPLFDVGSSLEFQAIVKAMREAFGKSTLPESAMSPQAILQATIMYGKQVQALPEGAELRVGKPELADDGSASLAIRILGSTEYARGYVLLLPGPDASWIIEYLHLEFPSESEDAKDLNDWDPYRETQ